MPNRDLLNYSSCEGTGEHNVCYYAHPPSAGVHAVPPYSHSPPPPPGLSNIAVSSTLAHSWESGHLLLADTLACLCLGDSGLPVPSPASCSPWRARLGVQPGNRGREVAVGTERRERGEEGRTQGHI